MIIEFKFTPPHEDKVKPTFAAESHALFSFFHFPTEPHEHRKDQKRIPGFFFYPFLKIPRKMEDSRDYL